LHDQRTANRAGTANLTVSVTDNSLPQKTAIGPISLTIAPIGGGGGLTFSTPTLPNATVGTPYLGTIGITGGTAPYLCSITSGTLPGGLTLAGCTISGLPTTPGTANFTIGVTDSSLPIKTGSGSISLTIDPVGGGGGLTFTSPTLPNATVGVPYFAPIGIIGGIPPYACSITAGALPGGLSLLGCNISGTPTVAGIFTPTITVTDGSSPQKTLSSPLNLTVTAPGGLTFSSQCCPTQLWVLRTLEPSVLSVALHLIHAQSRWEFCLPVSH